MPTNQPENGTLKLSEMSLYALISYSRMKNGQRAIRKRTAAARGADMILF